jgi:hypothetical protein
MRQAAFYHNTWLGIRSPYIAAAVRWAIARRHIVWHRENVESGVTAKKKGGSVSWAALPTNDKQKQKD